jgi:ribonucleoside-diphosphate reductase alpha chain
LEEVHPIFQRYQDEGKPISEKIFQTAWDVTPEWHLKIQEAFQKHTDNAVSKTVNFPESATAADIKEVYLMAVDMELKGITAYRDKSLPDQTIAACSIKREECS